MPSDTKAKTPLSLSKGKLELKKTVESGQVRQSFSHGRSKVVQVERKRTRQFERTADGKVQEVKAPAPGLRARAEEAMAKEAALSHGTLTEDEKAHRLKALQEAIKADEESRRFAEEEAKREAEEAAQRAEEEKKRAASAPPAAEAPVEGKTD